MFKLAVKPLWIATLALLGALMLAFKLALAITAFTPANQPVGFVGQDDITNYNLTSGHEVLYRGQYEKEYWGGDLIAYAIDGTGNVSTASQIWSGGGAADVLGLQGANRRIVTMNSAGAGTPFSWASLSTVLTGYGITQAVLNYLRGDRTGEVQFNGTLRQRASALGDIVHSRPLYVRDSSSTPPAPTVFVGANDGMLHAFDAVSGAERWAYVPSMLMSKMSNLAVTPYVHDYYVDGSVNVATLANGKRVLVGVLGGGGKGIYALDITGGKLAPADEAAAASNALWEITPSSINNAASTVYSNLGYTYANPTIAKLTGSGTDAVIVGNGYNNGGDYQAHLYVINADTGALISDIRAVAGTPGTAGSPNGLSTPVAVDTNNDGRVEVVYAGDLNGTMWKFDLAAGTATALLTTSPAQPITMSPGVAQHPNGGYMVNFATGAMLAAGDMTDNTSVFAAYGIWDGAPAANAALLTQTLTERCYTSGAAAVPNPCTSRVRTVSNNQPNWNSGASNHKGWKVNLPTGEKVVGDGSFIENGRFYFNGYNPTVSTSVQGSAVKGENWLMELDYLTGGSSSSNLPFLDLSGDHVLTDDDRVKDSAPAPVMTTDGIPVGKMLGIGVMSQPVLVQLTSLNNTLFNQNPDVTLAVVDLGTQTGVTGGHFDVDYFYAPPTGGASATATITVNSNPTANGQVNGAPANSGAITVNGEVIVPALTVTDITDGGASSSTNAGIIANLVTGGFTASRSNSTITITAPVGASYNIQPITIGPGTDTFQPYVAAVQAVTPVTGVAPTPGSIVITAESTGQTDVSIKCGTAYVTGAPGDISSLGSPTSTAAKLDDLYGKISGPAGKLVNGYTTRCTKNGSPTSTLSCSIAAPIGVSACSSFTLKRITAQSTNIGPSGGVNAVAGVTGSPAVPQSGSTNFARALSATAFGNTGRDASSGNDTCTGASINYPNVSPQLPGAYYPSGSGPDCAYKVHFHRYDKVFDVTGVNMLNPSSSSLLIGNSLPSLTQNFKVLVHNQYLNPAVNLHIGNPNYLYNVNFGYIPLRTYATSATLSLASLQTYQRNPNGVWPPIVNGSPVTDAAALLAAPKPIGSLAFNMPVDALSSKNWWGNGDVRAGLIPTTPQCVWDAVGTHDGNMYGPVIPPTNGTNGPGTQGWGTGRSDTPATATGARHGGALVIQLIRANTPDSAIELNVAGRQEYGWRVTSAQFANYVLAEYATYWHHPTSPCFHQSGWTKTPVPDTTTASQLTKQAGSTDPKIGNLAGTVGGQGGTITDVRTTITGAVTTTVITYSDGTSATIVRTANANGSVTIQTWDALTNPRTDPATSTQTIANTDGSLRTGGDERARQAARTGRISWRELVAP